MTHTISPNAPLDGVKAIIKGRADAQQTIAYDLKKTARQREWATAQAMSLYGLLNVFNEHVRVDEQIVGELEGIHGTLNEGRSIRIYRMPDGKFELRTLTDGRWLFLADAWTVFEAVDKARDLIRQEQI